MTVGENITGDVLRLMIETGLVSMKRSLALATNAQKRLETILDILPFCSLEEQLRGLEAAVLSTTKVREDERRFRLLRSATTSSHKQVRDLIETVVGTLAPQEGDYIEIPPPEYLTARQAVSLFIQRFDQAGDERAIEAADRLGHLARWAPHFPEEDRSAAVDEMFKLYPKVGLRLAYEALQRTLPRSDLSYFWRTVEELGDYDLCVRRLGDFAQQEQSSPGDRILHPFHRILLDNGVQGTRAVALANMALAIPDASVPRLLELTERLPSETWRNLARAMMSVRLPLADRLAIQKNAIEILRTWNVPAAPLQMLLSKLAYQFVSELIPEAADIAESLPEMKSRIETLLELAEAATPSDRRAIAEKVLGMITTVNDVDGRSRCLELLRSSQFRSKSFDLRNAFRLPQLIKRPQTSHAIFNLSEPSSPKEPCAEIAEIIDQDGDGKEIERIVYQLTKRGVKDASSCCQTLLGRLSKENQTSFLRKIAMLGPLFRALQGGNGIDAATNGLQCATEMFRVLSYPADSSGGFREAIDEPYREFKVRIDSEGRLSGGLSQSQIYRPRLSQVQYVRQVLGFPSLPPQNGSGAASPTRA